VIIHSGIGHSKIPWYLESNCILLFLSAEGFDNSTETLPGHGKMWPFAWHTDVYIVYGAVPENIVNMQCSLPEWLERDAKKTEQKFNLTT
jgi:hypothetical protein